MSSLELGYSVVHNLRSSAVSRIHEHNFRFNAGGKAENLFLVFASISERPRFPLFFGWSIDNRRRLSGFCRTTADPKSSFLTNSLHSPQAFFSSLRLTSRL